MRRFLVGLAALALALGTTSPAHAAGFRQVYVDQFTSIGPAWALYHGPGKPKTGPRTPANVTLGRDSDGTTYVRLWSRPSPHAYASGGMQLRMPQRYGAWRVRARSFAYGGQGTKYTIGLWPVPNCWPCAEDDFDESWDPTRQSYMITHHFRNAAGQHAMIHHGVGPIDLTVWHTFELDWTPTMDTYRVDGNVIWTSNAFIASVPQTLVMQTALTGAPISGPAVLDVDYAVVWSWS